MKQLLISSLFSTLALAAQAQKFTCTVSQHDILLGNYIEVEYKVEGAQNARMTAKPDWAGFDVVSGPNQSSQIRMVNGETSSTVSYKWQVQPRDTGTFVIPSATVAIGGGASLTDPIEVQVFPNPDNIIERPDVKDSEDGGFNFFGRQFGSPFGSPFEPQTRRRAEEKAQDIPDMRFSPALFGLISLLFVEKTAAQASFEASLDTRQAVVGSTVELVFSLKNASARGFRPPVLDGFRVASGPNISNSMTIVNGAVSRGTSWSFVLMPLREGRLDIGPATVSADGREMRTQPLSLEVVKSRASINSSPKKNAAPREVDEQKEVSVAAEPSAESAWIGQQIGLEYNLLTRRDLSGIEVNYEPKYAGFFSQNLERFDRTDRRETFGGKTFLGKTLKKVALFPQQTGTLTIEPMLLQAGVVEDDGMFGGFFSQARPTVLSTEPVKITVKPLPEPVPSAFCGAVGNYSLTATISQSAATTDDAVSVKITLTGNGDPRRINPPAMDWPAGLEVSQSRMAEESNFENGEEVVSVKTFEYVLLPKTPGDYELPTAVTIFDPEKGEFKTVATSQPLRLKISQGSNRPQPTAPLGEDFSMKNRPDAGGGLGSMFSPAVLLGVLGFVVAAGLLFFFLKKDRRPKPVEHAVVAAEPRPMANVDTPRRKLEDARMQMSRGDAADFYKSVGEAVEVHFSEKYRLEPGQVSRERILEKIEADGTAGADFAQRFDRVWRACEMARFAATADAAAMSSVLAEAQALVGIQ